eukprot:m.105708 g.105708  ORF g.105708 m.105708 type:complete len:433 (+) comp8924_c0_seq7:858-2156(+)
MGPATSFSAYLQAGRDRFREIERSPCFVWPALIAAKTVIQTPFRRLRSAPWSGLRSSCSCACGRRPTASRSGRTRCPSLISCRSCRSTSPSVCPRRMCGCRDPHPLLSCASVILLSLVLSLSSLLLFVIIAPFPSLPGLTQTDGITIIRLIRMLRILKMARHFEALRILGQALVVSMSELGLLLFLLSIAILIFSSAIYFAEQTNPDTIYTSIPDSFWWAIVTMTTVGYGDYFPITAGGRFVAAITALCGIIVLNLPVPFVINNFARLYQDSKDRTERKKRQNQIIASAVESVERRRTSHDLRHIAMPTGAYEAATVPLELPADISEPFSPAYDPPRPPPGAFAPIASMSDYHFDDDISTATDSSTMPLFQPRVNLAYLPSESPGEPTISTDQRPISPVQRPISPIQRLIRRRSLRSVSPQADQWGRAETEV